MSSEYEIPPQLEFKPLEEGFGEYRLEDGTIIKARVILADVFKIGEDPVGPRLAYSAVAAIRFVVPEEIRRGVASKPLADHVDMRDRGWRPVKIVEARPAESRYVLENKWLLRLRLEIVGVVKNENYRTPLVMPHYVARWATVVNIERLQEEGEEISE
jgi:hypothetical protein